MPKSLNPPPSSIRIVYDSVDIQNYCLFSLCSFECQANAVPGTAHIVIRDENRDLSFEVGKEVYLYVDEVLMWGGLVMRVGRQFAFPAVDTTNLDNVSARQWVLDCSDFNIWFDKRVLRNPADYTHAILTEGVHKDGYMIRTLLPDYIDVPPGVVIESPEVMDIADFGDRGNDGTFTVQYQWVEQGSPWRQQMDEFAARSSATYYLSADKKLYFINLETDTIPWVFSDYAPGDNWTNRVPMREVNATQDGSILVDDALIWGGNETDGGLFFARYEDPDQIDTVGRWQYGEVSSQQTDEIGVSLRARDLVEGPPGTGDGIQTGLRFPLWRVTLTWFGHDIPRVADVPQHIRPGNIVNIYLYTMGDGVDKPLIQFLPLRNMTITFPQLKGSGQVWVRFQGEFGISYSDSRYLWAYLLNRGQLTTKQVMGAVDNSSTSSHFGDFGTFSPTQLPDGHRTVFTFPFPFVKGSEQVYVNGLLWRVNREYTVTGPTEITFNTALAKDDQLYITARTGIG